jgi:Spy/CpxP family protein refolding chaperone
MKGMHMLKLNLGRIAGTLLFACILFLGANLYAQDNDISKDNDAYKDNAQKWTTQLNQKVNLTQDQQTRIEGILVDYQNAKANADMKNYDQLQTTYNTRIESVLNDNQKQMYKDYSQEWWKSMSAPATESGDQDKY